MSRPARNDFRHLHRLRVRWAEVDMQKIVFNGHYLMYFDTAVADYWRALALPVSASTSVTNTSQRRGCLVEGFISTASARVGKCARTIAPRAARDTTAASQSHHAPR